MPVPILLAAFLALVLFHLLVNSLDVSRQACKGNKGLSTVLAREHFFPLAAVLCFDMIGQATSLQDNLAFEALNLVRALPLMDRNGVSFENFFGR